MLLQVEHQEFLLDHSLCNLYSDSLFGKELEYKLLNLSYQFLNSVYISQSFQFSKYQYKSAHILLFPLFVHLFYFHFNGVFNRNFTCFHLFFISSSSSLIYPSYYQVVLSLFSPFPYIDTLFLILSFDNNSFLLL